MKKFIIGLVVLAVLVVGLVAVYVAYSLNQSYQGEDATVVVENGDTFGKVNQRLFNQGIISNKRVFHYYAKYKNVLTKFRAGSYTIPRGSTIPMVLDTLVNGQPNLTSITIPEGKNMYEIARLLDQAGICSEADFLDAVQHPDLLSQLKIASII